MQKKLHYQEYLDEKNSSTCRNCFLTPWHVTQIPDIAGPLLFMLQQITTDFGSECFCFLLLILHQWELCYVARILGWTIIWEAFLLLLLLESRPKAWVL